MISTRYPIHNGKIALYIIICYKFVYFFIYILFVLIHLSQTHSISGDRHCWNRQVKIQLPYDFDILIFGV
jgi:hypothetical protein